MKRTDFIKQKICDNNYKKIITEFNNGSAYGFDLFEFSLLTKQEVSESELMHAHNFYMVEWVKTGDFYCNVDFNSYHICDNTLVFFAPGQFHSLHKLFSYSGMGIYFKEDFFDSLNSRLSNHIKFTLFDSLYALKIETSETKRVIDDLFDLIPKFISDTPSFIDNMSVYSIFASLLCRIISSPEYNAIHPNNLLPEKHELYFQYLNLIEKEYKTCHVVKEYATKLGVSQKVLTQCTNINANMTPISIIHNRLMTEAKRLLLFSDLRIANIAYELGFYEPSHFVKFFNKHEGLTPLKFRSLHSAS